MKFALTIKDPWAYAIENEGKDVENRTWRPNVTAGPAPFKLMVHAGKSTDSNALWFVEGLSESNCELNFELLDGQRWMVRDDGLRWPLGAIRSVVTVKGWHVAGSDECEPVPDGIPLCSHWAQSNPTNQHRSGKSAKTWHWVLGNVQVLPTPIPLVGRLGLWEPPQEAIDAVLAQL